jgi:hypothetical protein
MKKTNNLILDPSWITGFTDAEGCFSVILTKRPNLKWRIMVSFEINPLPSIEKYFYVRIIFY